MLRNLVLLVSIAAGGFVLWSTQQLPETVASHFGMAGQADNYSSRPVFAGIMLGAATFLPLLLWFTNAWLARKGAKIPNRDYWYQPGRAEATVRFLEIHAALLSIVLAIFLCFVQWQIVLAHQAGSPPTLDTRSFIAGLVAFLGFAVLWAALPFWRFRKRS